MNPKHFKIRTNRTTGDFFLTLEKPGHPMKRLANITEELLLALVADLNIDPSSKGCVREIHFDDGTAIKITVEDMGVVRPASEQSIAA